MKVLITGASGFIGEHLVNELSGGFSIACLVLPGESIHAEKPVTIFTGDVTRPESLEEACAWPDMVIHAAGLIQAPDNSLYYKVNEQGTRNITNVLARVNPKLKLFVLFSSLSVAGPVSDIHRPVDESSPVNPIDHYGRSKLKAEAIMADLPFRYVILRLPSVYGGGSKEYIVLMKLMHRRRIKPKVGSGNYFSMIYVEDLAKCLKNVLIGYKKLKNDIYYVADGPRGYHSEDISHAVSIQFMHKLFTLSVPIVALKAIGLFFYLLGKVTRKSFLLNPEQIRLLTSNFVCNPALFQSQFGLEKYTSIDEGMKKSYLWYKARGWL